MKKLFLLLSVGAFAVSSNAQQATRQRAVSVDPSMYTTKVPTKYGQHATTVSKTTATIQLGDWFFYNVACDGGTSATTAALIGQYPDSNIYYPGGTPSPFYIWSHGMGVSFDPTSPFFSDGWLNTSVTAPSIKIDSNKYYYLDSIDVAGYYQRVNSTTDTLYIDVTYTSDTGSWDATYHGAALVSFGICNPPASGTDTSWTTGEASYDYATRTFSSSTKHTFRITKILDAAAADDTTSNGLHEWSFAMKTNTSGTNQYTVTSPSGDAVTGKVRIPKGAHIVAYTHFGSGTAYPYGTNNTAANLWLHYGNDFGFNPLQYYLGDANEGLNNSTEDCYHISGFSYINIGSTQVPDLTPTYFYTAPLGVHNPWYGFHLLIDSTVTVNDVHQGIVSTKAFPDPATNELNVSFSLEQSANVTVSLYNMLGQVVATTHVANTANGVAKFNTSALPAGTYIYNISAEGEHATGHVVVAH